MAEFNVTVSLSPEDRTRVDRLITVLRNLHDVKPALDTVIADPIPADSSPYPSEAPAEAPTKPADEPVAEPVKEYTLEDIRARVMTLSRKSAAIKAKVKEALNKYADSVPKLKPEDYSSFMKDLEAIA